MPCDPSPDEQPLSPRLLRLKARLERCAATEFGRIIVAGGIAVARRIVMNRQSSRFVKEAIGEGGQTMMARVSVMHRCGLSRTAQSDQ